MSITFSEIIIVCKSKHKPWYELLESKCSDGVKFYENTCPEIELLVKSFFLMSHIGDLYSKFFLSLYS